MMQPHDKDGKALSYNDQTGKFNGEIAYTKDASGKDVYKEATVTVFKKSFDREGVQDKRELGGNNGLNKSGAMVGVFSHDGFHNTDPQSIQAVKDTQNGVPNSYPVEEKAEQFEKKVIQEIK